MIVRSRNGNTFVEIAESPRGGKRDIFLELTVRQGTAFGELLWSNCGKTGHIAAICYLKDKKDDRVNKLGSEAGGSTIKIQGSQKDDIKCYNCGQVGQMTRDCKKHRHTKQITQLPETGVEGRPSDG